MAEKTKIQYINFYTDGSAARRYELPRSPQVQPQQEPKTQPRRQTRRVIRVDPLALASIAVSLVIFLLLASGMLQLYTLEAQQQALYSQLESLTEHNAALTQEYESGYDLDQIREEALALGMIPVDQARHITVNVQTPVQPQVEPDLWTQITDFFAGLFA